MPIFTSRDENYTQTEIHVTVTEFINSMSCDESDELIELMKSNFVSTRMKFPKSESIQHECFLNNLEKIRSRYSQMTPEQIESLQKLTDSL